MQWAEAGSLDDYIDVRLGRPTHLPHVHPSSSSTAPQTPTADTHSRSARIRAFRALQRAGPAEREHMRESVRGAGLTAVHLLSASEVRELFLDVVSGLSFLVRNFWRDI